jgi:protein-L-isoaspartate O-methyltransferase
LIELAKKNIKKDQPSLLESKNIEIMLGDGWKVSATICEWKTQHMKGVPEYAPFDVIHVGAGADTLPGNDYKLVTTLHIM